jgi:hypothetical protein
VDSVIIRTEGDIHILPGGGDPDGVDRLLGEVKGAIALTIDEEGNWFVLVNVGGEKFEWMDIIETIPFSSERTYTSPTTKVRSIGSVKPEKDKPSE